MRRIIDKYLSLFGQYKGVLTVKRNRMTGAGPSLSAIIMNSDFCERPHDDHMLVYDFLGFLEKHCARAQGKGYGSGSIDAEISSIKRLLQHKNPKLCIDIGGNIGEYSAALHRHFPHANIVCFEPSKTNLTILENRFSTNERIRIMPFGVADQSGTHTLYSDKPGSGLASLTKRDLTHRNNTFETQESIQTMRFDEFWQHELDSSRIDILKMDIEGHELDALTGCGPAIEKTDIIQFEFGGCNVDTRTYFRDFWSFFKDRGFSLYRITPFGTDRMKRYRERDECFRTTNFLALNENMGR